jgi:hypothetical protein
MAKKKAPRVAGDYAAAVAAVKRFLTYVVDKPDEAKAKAQLSKATLESGSFELPSTMAGAKYTIAEPRLEAGQLWIPVDLSGTDGEGTPQKMTVPFALVQEDGQWKLDMMRTIEKLMGGMEGVVDKMVDAVGQVMEGVGDALAAGLQSVASSSSDNAPVIDPVALEQFRAKVLLPLQKEIHDRIDMDLPLDVDFPSLLNVSDPSEINRRLDLLCDRVFANLAYWISQVNEKIPLQDRVKAIRFEGVGTPEERAIFAEGARIIYRLNLAGDNGFYEGDDVACYLGGTVAGMAESAPPGDVLGRPSYRPSGDAAAMAANYQEFVLPVLTVRLAEMLGRELPIDMNWILFESDSEDIAGLWLWGLNRVCGAFGMLMAVPEIRAMREEWIGEIRSIEIVPMPSPGHKAVRVEGNMLRLFIDPSAGESGCFYEYAIAEEINRALKLRLRPMKAELERYAKSREASLAEIFGRPIQYAFDFDTFMGHPEESKSVFAMTLLREHGIDTVYYALHALAEKNPNFKQQVPQRIAWIYLDCVPTPEDKRVHGEQTTIVNHLFLFEGYNGYLTQKELEARLPAIVAGMPDQNWEAPAPAAEPAPEPPAEAHVSYGVPEPESPQDDQEAQAFAGMQAQIQATLPAFASQLQLMLGRAVPLEIAWETLDRKIEAGGMLLNACLTPVLGGLGMLGQDPAIRDALAARVDKIVLRQSDAPANLGFSLDDRVLTYAAVLSATVPTMDPQTAANLLRELLTSPLPKAAKKVVATRKPAVKPAKSPAPKTPPAKKAAPKKSPPKKAPPKKAPPKKAPPKKAPPKKSASKKKR